MKKILYCIAPHSALFKKRPYCEFEIGPGIVRSILDKEGFDVDCLDFNALLNHHRGRDELLTKDDLYILANPRFTALYAGMALDSLRYPSRMSEVIETLAAHLPEKDYSCIAFSIPRPRQNILEVTQIINFALLLAKRLKSATKAQVLIGGQSLKFLNLKSAREHFRHFGCDCVDYIFLENVGQDLLKVIGSEKPLKRPRIVSNRIFPCWNKVIDSISRYGVFQKAISRYRRLKKSSRHPLHNHYLKQLKIKPTFKGFDMGCYQVNVHRVFDLGRMNGQARPWINDGIIVYPLQFIKGCTHNCAYCNSGAFGLSVLTVSEAVDQIEQILERDPRIKYFRFLNSQINFSNRFALRFADEIIKRKLNIFFTDSACLRNTKDEVFAALREAGCVKLWVGVDSASERILKISNKQLSLKEIEHGLSVLQRNNIWITANLITCFPSETDDDHRNNVRFIKNHVNVVSAWSLFMFELYPNAPYYIYSPQYGIDPGKAFFSGGRYFSFTEKAGADFKERWQDSLRRYSELKALIPPHNRIADNDYLMFYCFANGCSKADTEEFIKSYYETVKNDPALLSDLFKLNT